MKAECPDCPPAHHFSSWIFYIRFQPAAFENSRAGA